MKFDIYKKFKNYFLLRITSAKLFLYFISISTVINLIVSLSYSIISSNTIKQENLSSAHTTLLYIRQASELNMTQIDNVISSLVSDTIVLNALLYYNNGDISALRYASSIIRNIGAPYNANIYSTSIFYTEESMVLSSNTGLSSVDEYYDRDLLYEVQQKKLTNGMVINRRITRESRTVELPCVTIVKPIPIGVNPPSAYVIVNVNPEYFMDYISFASSPQQTLLILDENDNIIVSNKNNAWDYNIDVMPLVQDILKNGDGEYLTKLKGEQVLTAFQTSEDYNWKYISLIPYSAIPNRLSTLYFNTFIISIISLIIGGILSIKLAEQSALPLKRLHRLTEDYTDTDETEKDIYDTIHSRIQTIMDKKKTVEDLLHENMPVLVNNFLLDVLSGNLLAENNISDKFEYYGVNIDCNLPCVVYLISLVNKRSELEEYSQKQKATTIVFLTDIIKTYISDKNYKGAAVNSGLNEIAVILNISEDGGFGAIKKIGEEIQNEMLLFNNHLAMSSGKLCENIHEIYGSYIQANEALAFGSTFGAGKMCFFEDIEDMQSQKYAYPYHKEKVLIEFLKQGDYGNSAEINSEIFGIFAAQKLSHSEMFFYYCTSLLQAVTKCVIELGLFDDCSLSQRNVNIEIQKMQAPEEVKGIFEELYKEIIQLIEGRKKILADKTIESVMDYIKKNYSSKDLDLLMISKNVYLSVSYLSKLFKDSMGTTIKQVINDVRIEKAKELLENSDYSINKIADLVGYDKPNSFLKMFKKYTSETPSAYRSLLALKTDEKPNK